MAEREKLIAKRNKLRKKLNERLKKIVSREKVLRKKFTEEMKEISRKLHEIDLLEKANDPYRQFAEKYAEKLGVRPHLTIVQATGPIQKYRLELMRYLIEHGHTLLNPISYWDLRASIKTLKPNQITHVVYNNYAPLSPVYGGLKIIEENFRVTELYIEDLERAKMYVTLMEELVHLSPNL
jgi:hypothetical protein